MAQRWQTTHPTYVQRRRAGCGSISYGILCAIFLGFGIPWLLDNIGENGEVNYDDYDFWLGIIFTGVGAILGILFLVTLVKYFKLQLNGGVGGGCGQLPQGPTQQLAQNQPPQAYNQNYNNVQPYPSQYGQQSYSYPTQQQPYNNQQQSSLYTANQQTQWAMGVPVTQAAPSAPNENVASAPVFKL